MPPRFRPLRTLAIGIALGVASELATIVAGILWAGAPHSLLGQGQIETDGRPSSFSREETALVTTLWIDWGRSNPAIPDTDRVALPEWSFAWHLARDVPAGVVRPPQYVELAYGWPWRSSHALLARDRSQPDSSSNPQTVSGMRLPSRAVQSGGYTFYLYRAFPTSPIWPGLIAGSAVFAAGWTVSYFGVGAIRRRILRRRGRCAVCGYDLRATPLGTPCPECGVTGR